MNYVLGVVATGVVATGVVAAGVVEPLLSSLGGILKLHLNNCFEGRWHTVLSLPTFKKSSRG